MKAPTIDGLWTSYRQRVIPADAPAVQVIESRRAFYAGCQSLLTAIFGALDPDDEATDADVTVMATIEAELRSFAELVKAGVA